MEGGKGQAGRGKSGGPCGHVKEQGSSPKGGGGFRRVSSSGVVGTGVAVHNIHDGSQNILHPTCSFQNVPRTLDVGVNLGRPVTVAEMAPCVAPEARQARQHSFCLGRFPSLTLWKLSLQPSCLPCCEEAQCSLNEGNHRDTSGKKEAPTPPKTSSLQQACGE